MQRRQDRKEKELKVLVEITVTWHEPDAKAEGEWRRWSCKRRPSRVLYRSSKSEIHKPETILNDLNSKLFLNLLNLNLFRI